MKNKLNTVTMIASIVCAIVWNLNLLKYFIADNQSADYLILEIICAGAFTISAVIWTVYYIKQKNSPDK
ncbi:MAG: hypothetical protein UD936_08750 [Acutalibacteraceae bacterium]|nr:hypothetical protein [Acutalibacteraceae bacterium]